MAIQRLEPEQQASFQSVPFLKDWLEDKPFPEGEIFRIRRFRYTSKGLCVITDQFQGFLFANEKLCNQILEAIGHYLKQLDAYALVLVFESKNRRKFTIALDDELNTTFKELEQHHWIQEFNDEYPKHSSSHPHLADVNPLIKESRRSAKSKN